MANLTSKPKIIYKNIASWLVFKSTVASKNLRIQVEENEKYYLCTAIESVEKAWTCRVWKAAYLATHSVVGVSAATHVDWETDLVTYTQPKSDLFHAEPSTAADGIPEVRQSSRPRRTMITFVGRGDSPADPFDIGNGPNYFQINHTVGDGDVSIDVEFNSANNRTYIHEGYATWSNCQFDAISLHCVAHKCTTVAGTGTYFDKLYYPGHPWHNKLIVPSAGNGTINVTSMVPVFFPVGQETGERPPCFWDAIWDGTQWTNITAAPTGNGTVNLFSEELILNSFVNHVLFNGTNTVPWMLQTSESEEIGQGMFLRLQPFTRGTDHNWDAAITLVMHRARTC